MAEAVARIILEDGTLDGKKELPPEVFAVPVRKEFLNEVLNEYLKKDITASTKTRAEVRGGGRKPWRQKGTGRARVGSIRSPLWRGGGVTFGPKFREKENSLPKKKRKLALKQTLSMLAQDNKIFYTEKLGFEKTKNAFLWLTKNFKKGDKIAIINEKIEKNLLLPFRNIPGVLLKRRSDINMRDLIYCDAVIFVGESIDKVGR
ncbi:MAG: 50S ribosomal protein L4 [Elusimicrobia bacterium]|nr:50S ribosomal protein L4 [Elusimicrobiota bacterium]